MKKASEHEVRVGDEAVKAKTGRTSPEWFAVLDKGGCASMNHKRIVAHLTEAHGIGPWWRQMVTVAYEQARGLRTKHEKADGFSAGASRTIAAPVSAAFAAWHDAKRRKGWVPDAAIGVRMATKDKSLRLDWTEDGTRLVVNFYPKGAAKTQVTVDHEKLRSKAAAEKRKAYWAEALGRLKQRLETAR